MRLTLLAAAMLSLAPAARARLVIAPTTVTVDPERRTAIVTVENASDQPVDLQMRAYDWTQPDGQDTLTPAADIVVSPAIASVPPRAKQVFRVLLGQGILPTGSAERAWRLRLNELPRDDRPAVAINLEFLLPVFQAPRGAAPRLAWAWTPDGHVTVTNTGNRRARLNRLALADQRATVELPGAVSAYLLSGASRSFSLSAPVTTPSAARLIASGDTGPLDAPPAALAAR